MGQRQRKRNATKQPSARSQPPAQDKAGGVPSMRARPEEAPQPSWAPVPLTELVILIGLLFAAGGFIWADGPRRTAMIVGGVALISLASAELALREHLAGYRSHTLVLSSLPSAFLAGVCWVLWREFALVPRQTAPIVFLATFGFCVWQLRELFKRRSGGISFRV
jgi:hypothetical protein